MPARLKNHKRFLFAMLGVVVAQGLVSPGDGFARAAAPGTLRLADRSLSVAGPKLAASPARSLREATLDVRLASRGPGSVAVARTDFELSANGDIFGVHEWSARGSRIRISPGHSRSFHMSFRVPDAVVKHGALFYRPAGGGISGVLPLGRSRTLAGRTAAASPAQQPVLNTYWLTRGVGHPWGTAIDGAGHVWFAEPGCDLAPTCAADAPPGQIGELDPASGAVSWYTLPGAPGNQPAFVAFDSSGNLWFTTPGNSMIGEFSPSSRTFLGQWPVTNGSGPWDLVLTNGQLWYTEHLDAAIGVFNPATHAHQDFRTPSANSNPYGIAAGGGLIWFTENNSSVDRVAVLDTTRGNAISEYPIVQPLNGTPHLIVVGASGQPWWTEGWSNTIATLDPAAATPGSCGPPAGTCNGVRRFQLPPSSVCGGEAHTSGIAFDGAANRLWIDNSLTAQVGSFTPSTGTFALNTVSNCSAHPHDGLTLDPAGNVWFDEQFANAIGELIPPGGPPPLTSASPPTGPGGSGQTSSVANLPLAPANTAAPTIRGNRTQAHMLTARRGSWTNAPTDFSYRWQRCTRRCVNIALATGGSYKLSARDIDASVRVVVTARNAGGSAQAKSRRLGPIGPSPTRITGALSKLLAASTKGWPITKLLERGGYTGSFGAPSGGSLKISWHAVVAGRRPVLVAAGHRHFSKRGTAKVAIRLTGMGTRLLKRAGKLTLAAKVIFIPAGGSAVTGLKRWSARSARLSRR